MEMKFRRTYLTAITTKLFEFSGNFSIAWKMKQETILYSYSLTTANDNATYKGRNPKSWILYGSKDGYNWEEIDVVNESGMEDENYKTYNYAVDKTGSYKYYKMDVKASYGNSIQLSEIALRGATVSPSKYDILFTGDWLTDIWKNLQNCFITVTQDYIRDGETEQNRQR